MKMQPQPGALPYESSAEPAAPPMSESAAMSFLWSAVETWGGKLAQFVVFLVLARLLSPTDLGLAASSAVVLLFAAQVAEFGFGDAIVQSHEIEARDINGPFYFSIALSCVMTAVIYLSSGTIERALNTPGVGIVLAVSSGVAPLTTLSLFQEAINRRAFQFRRLALRAFFAQIGGGIIAIIAAFFGAGVWSLIIQAYSAAIISNVWMWRSPLWTPSLAMRLEKFARLARFGSAVVLTRMLDFISQRTLDIVILTFYGAAALGLYTAGARLYLMLLTLLQQVVNNVALAFLARISQDRERLGKTYLLSSLASSYFASPVFFVCAALAPELVVSFFGQRWAQSATLAQPLLFLGAIQCVQFVNGPYFASVGRPHYTFLLNILKAAATLTVLIASRGQGITYAVILFCIAQLLPTPINFFLLAREVGLRPQAVAFRIGPVLMIGAASAAITMMLRGPVGQYVSLPLIRAIVLGIVFTLVYLGATFGLLPKRTMEAWDFAITQVRKAMRQRKRKAGAE